jgi:hypothetical protein
MPSGLWRIGPVIGVNWNGGAKARVDPVTVGYQSLLDISLAIGCLKKASSQAMT